MDKLYYGIAVLVLFFVVIGLGFFYVIAMKWVNFGVSLFFKKSSLKQNLGFLFLRDSGNNFDLPHIIDLREEKKEEKDEESWIYARQQLMGASFFGKPFVMFDNDDNKTSLGLYFHATDEDAEPMYHANAEGELYTNQDGNNMPMLTQIKPAVSLPPSLFRSVVTQEVFKNLKKYIKDFVGKYKYVLLIVMGIGIGIGILIYFAYNNQEKMPEILKMCKQAAEACVVQ